MSSEEQTAFNKSLFLVIVCLFWWEILVGQSGWMDFNLFYPPAFTVENCCQANCVLVCGDQDRYNVLSYIKQQVQILIYLGLG